MKTDWPENEKIGELLFQLQQLSISVEWLVQELHYARKQGIDDSEKYRDKVLDKMEDIFKAYNERIGEI